MRYPTAVSARSSVAKALTAARSRSGQNLIEYAFILLLVALIAITLSQFPTAVFGRIGDLLSSFV